MISRCFAFFLFFLVFNHSGQAQNIKYKIGDSLFVWASSLNIRETPNSQARIVGKVAFGESVRILEDSLEKVPFVYVAQKAKKMEGSEQSKAYRIKGFWVKVEVRETVGFVFDGYLSKLPPITLGEDKFGRLESWALKDLKLKSKKVADKKSESAWTEYFGAKNQVVVRIGHTDKTSFREVRINNISFEEGCMLGMKIFDGLYLQETTPNRYIFKSEDDNGDCKIFVSKLKTWIVITLDCSS